MNITGGNSEHPAIESTQSPDSDLLQRRPSARKLSRRKIRGAGAGVRLRKDIGGSPAGRRSRPHTPLLRWKFDEDVEASNGCDAEEECLGRKCHLKARAPLSARKLAAGIWRLQLPAVPADGENLGFQGGAGRAGTPFYSHHHSKTQDSQVSESLESPRSVSGPRNGTFREVEPSFHFSNAAMEGATKWDPIRWKAAEGGTKHIHGHQQKAHTSSMVSVLEEELDQARARIQELETEQLSYKKKIEQFLKKVSEERALWRSREHEKIRTILEDMKVELTRERKTRQRAEMVNAKLVNELADARVAAKRYMQEYEKERKTRELIEEVCDELAKEIGEDKAEVEVLKRESAKLRDEVDEERRMLQMAEVWREERVQMKLIDAKVTLEEKYSQMNRLIADLETLLCSKGINNPDMDEIKKFAAAVNVHNIQEFTYEPPNPDDIFSIFEDHMVTEDNNPQRHHHHHHHTKSYTNQSDGYGGEDGGSEWETVSNMSRTGAGSTPATDISEVCSTPAQPTRKGSSMSRRRCPNGGRHANGGMIMMSPNRGGKEDDVSATNSGDSGNHHINRGMKGCIEWPRNSMQKNSLKSKLLEAKMESQKIQLRHVLKQKI